MPEMTGPRLVQRVSEQRPEIRVLYMSGHADDILGQRGMINGGVPFIAKPFDLPDLLAKVREVLEDEKSAGEISDASVA
jgi:two-component system cell cycle sensor histidine kinase/response regulator CckA